jgi:glucosylceramidase
MANLGRIFASAPRNDDGLLSVQLLNTTKRPLEFSLQIGAQFAPITIPANSIQTVRVPFERVGMA